VVDAYKNVEVIADNLADVQTDYELLSAALATASQSSSRNRSVTILDAQKTAMGWGDKRDQAQTSSDYAKGLKQLLNIERDNFKTFADSTEIGGTKVISLTGTDDYGTRTYKGADLQAATAAASEGHKDVPGDEDGKELADISASKDVAPSAQDASNQDPAEDGTGGKCDNPTSWLDAAVDTLISPVPDKAAMSEQAYQDAVSARSIGRNVVTLCPLRNSQGGIARGFGIRKVYAGGDCGYIVVLNYLVNMMVNNSPIYVRLPQELKTIVEAALPLVTGDGTDKDPIKFRYNAETGDRNVIGELRTYLRAEVGAKMPEDASEYMEQEEISKLAEIMGTTICVWEGDAPDEGALKDWRYFDDLSASGILNVDIRDPLRTELTQKEKLTLIPMLMASSGSLAVNNPSGGAHLDIVVPLRPSAPVFDVSAYNAVDPSVLASAAGPAQDEEANEEDADEEDADEEDANEEDANEGKAQGPGTSADQASADQTSAINPNVPQPPTVKPPAVPLGAPPDTEEPPSQGPLSKAADAVGSAATKVASAFSSGSVKTTTVATPEGNGTRVTVTIHIPDGSMHDVHGPGGNSVDTTVANVMSSMGDSTASSTPSPQPELKPKPDSRPMTRKPRRVSFAPGTKPKGGRRTRRARS